jgi:hypothetical protein
MKVVEAVEGGGDDDDDDGNIAVVVVETPATPEDVALRIFFSLCICNSPAPDPKYAPFHER